MKIFNGEEFTILTHFDLDGAGGPLLFRHCFGEKVTGVFPCGYGKVKANIQKHACKNIVLTDLSLNQENIDLVNELYENVYYFDHHPQSTKLDFPKHWHSFVNLGCCATKLVYLWLEYQKFDLSCAKEFVEMVNDYDVEIWRRE